MTTLSRTESDAAWRRHRAELLGFVSRRVPDRASAEDIVHEVFAKAWARRATLRDSSKLRSWLFQVTRNAVADHYRRRRPHEPLPEDLREPQAAPAAERELARCLTPLMARLSDEDRRALTLSELDGLTQRELASREKLSLPGAKSRVQRARRRLRDALLACCRVELERGGVSDFRAREDCGC